MAPGTGRVSSAGHRAVAAGAAPAGAAYMPTGLLSSFDPAIISFKKISSASDGSSAEVAAAAAAVAAPSPAADVEACG